jgi:hypothetical protein
MSRRGKAATLSMAVDSVDSFPLGKDHGFVRRLLSITNGSGQLLGEWIDRLTIGKGQRSKTRTLDGLRQAGSRKVDIRTG